MIVNKLFSLALFMTTFKKGKKLIHKIQKASDVLFVLRNFGYEFRYL